MVSNNSFGKLHAEGMIKKIAFKILRYIIAIAPFRDGFIRTLKENYPDETVGALVPIMPRLSSDLLIQIVNSVCTALPRLSSDVLIRIVDSFCTILPRPSSDVLARVLDSVPSVLPQISADVLDRFIRSVLGYYAVSYHDSFLPVWCIDTIKHLTGSTMGYGQEGEDVLFERLLDCSEPGFFVDVGAFHPIRFSNTYGLYRRGWRGINIDATPGSMDAFKRVRSEDTNIECAISDKNEPLKFHIFAEAALNTFRDDIADLYMRIGYQRLRIHEIQPRSLAALLDEHLPEGQAIKLMNIDVEGEEMGVLSSNNWEKYNPEWIILEMLDVPFDALTNHEFVVFLGEHGYTVVSKLAQSVIFKRV